MGEAVVTLQSPNQGELLGATARPAGNLGVRVDAALTERIVSEVHDQPGALPLLQHTLAELYEGESQI